MKTKWWAFVLVFICTLLTSTAQVFFKLGSEQLSFNLFDLFFNFPLIFGLFLYGIGAMILILSLRGGQLSVLYPIIATSYIWVSIYSIVLFQENMNTFRWTGVFVIIVGIACIGMGSSVQDKQNKPKETDGVDNGTHQRVTDSSSEVSNSSIVQEKEVQNGN